MCISLSHKKGIEMTDKKIIAYIVGLDGKVRPLVLNEEHEVVVEETVVDEGY